MQNHEPTGGGNGGRKSEDDWQQNHRLAGQDDCGGDGVYSSIDIAKDIQRLAVAVEDGDSIEIWRLLRKIIHVMEVCKLKPGPGEEELKELMRCLENLREIVTPRDFAILGSAIYLIELVLWLVHECQTESQIASCFVGELAGIHREYTQLLTGTKISTGTHR